MPVTLNASTSSGFIATSDTSGVIQLQGNGTSILSGSASNTLALQGATSTTGTGIAFPATASLSSNANTLDDYEEGSFTPAVRGSGTAGSFTYNTGTTWGRYVKVGPLVNIQLAIQVTAGSGSTNNLWVTGLPFTAANFSNYYASISVGYFAFATGGWDSYFISGLVQTGNTYINLYYSGNTSSLPLGSSAMHGSSNIFISGSYLTDS